MRFLVSAHKIYIYLFVTFVLTLGACRGNNKEAALFELMDKTGIDFNNKVQDNDIFTMGAGSQSGT
jgi:hypothetical protein